MDKEKALSKIKKCLALAASPNPHEAAAALRQAQKLMDEYGLTMTDVSLADVTEAKAQARTVDLVKWEAMLSKAVALAFGCEVYSLQGAKIGPDFRVMRQRDYVFVGVGAAAEVASYAYEVLARQCAKDRRTHISRQPKNCKPKTKTARGDAFAEGWVHGVREKLDRFGGAERNTQLLQQYMARDSNIKTATPKDRAAGKNISHNDYYNGLRAGKAARLDRGIGGQAPQGVLAA